MSTARFIRGLAAQRRHAAATSIAAGTPTGPRLFTPRETDRGTRFVCAVCAKDLAYRDGPLAQHALKHVREGTATKGIVKGEDFEWWIAIPARCEHDVYEGAETSPRRCRNEAVREFGRKRLCRIHAPRTA